MTKKQTVKELVSYLKKRDQDAKVMMNEECLFIINAVPEGKR